MSTKFSRLLALPVAAIIAATALSSCNSSSTSAVEQPSQGVSTVTEVESSPEAEASVDEVTETEVTKEIISVGRTDFLRIDESEAEYEIVQGKEYLNVANPEGLTANVIAVDKGDHIFVKSFITGQKLKDLIAGGYSQADAPWTIGAEGEKIYPSDMLVWYTPEQAAALECIAKGRPLIIQVWPGSEEGMRALVPENESWQVVSPACSVEPVNPTSTVSDVLWSRP